MSIGICEFQHCELSWGELAFTMANPEMRVDKSERECTFDHMVSLWITHGIYAQDAMCNLSDMCDVVEGSQRLRS